MTLCKCVAGPLAWFGGSGRNPCRCGIRGEPGKEVGEDGSGESSDILGTVNNVYDRL